ncbi:MAG: hypothetical protein VZS44_08350 [Bacilli bacterium]|nr:hypothetical protein [Bacilli bacterium]
MSNSIKDNINSILKDLYESAKDNNCLYNKKEIYHYLIKRNVSKQDRDIYFYGDPDKHYGPNKIFDKMVNKYNNVGNKDEQRIWCRKRDHFCWIDYGGKWPVLDSKDIFKNIRYKNGVDGSSCIKMYIPMDYVHIEGAANRIFDFLNKNKIKHSSKVRDEISFDDIVVRVNNKEDALKLQNFIDNDEYIQEGMIKGNSFAFSNNGVNYVFDGNTSFNSVLSELLIMYINDCLNNNFVDVDSVSADGFLKFIDRKSKDCNNFRVKYDDINMISVYLDDFIIINLIKHNLHSGNDMDCYWSYINLVKDKDKMMKIYSCLMKDDEIDIDAFLNINKKSSKNDLFNEVILVMTKKYPLGFDKNEKSLSGIDFVYSFLRGNIKAITRDNDLRGRVKKNLSVNDCFDVVREIDIPVSDNKKMYIYIKMVILNDIISSMKLRFSNNALSNIEEYINTGDSKWITRNGGARDLAVTLTARDIKQLFIELNVKNLDEYVEKYYNNFNNNNKRRRNL